MVYKLTLTIKDLEESEIPKILELLKKYEKLIEKIVLEKKEE